MDTFQHPPPPLLPDVVSPQQQQPMHFNHILSPTATADVSSTSCFDSEMDCQPQTTTTLMNNGGNCFKLKASIETPDPQQQHVMMNQGNSSMNPGGMHSSLSPWNNPSSVATSSSASSTFNDYPAPPPIGLDAQMQQLCLPPTPPSSGVHHRHGSKSGHAFRPQPPLPPPRNQPPPPPPPPPHHRHQFEHQHHSHSGHHLQQQHDQQQQQQSNQLSQLPDIDNDKVIQEFEKIICNENDKVVLTNSVCLLFRFSIDSVRGLEICHLMSASPIIMSRLYYVLLDEQFNDDDLIICYATGNLTNISKYEHGRAAILRSFSDGQNHLQSSSAPSDGIKSLLRSLQHRDSNVVIFAITAIHNLLLDRNLMTQEMAKEQIKYGIQYIVHLLDNKFLIHNYEFKVIVLDCLQILAYGNNDNRLAIRRSEGPYLILRTIRENLDNQPADELIETASRVLKSLSACAENKIDIIKNEGIDILTNCIKRGNQEILKTCLWTLRNLSDLINENRGDQNDSMVFRLLQILDEYAEEPCITTCALGILANITCNNESIKQFICENDGVHKLLNMIGLGTRDGRDLDKEILEPAVCALCHLMNQTLNPNLAEGVKRTIKSNYEMFQILANPSRKISSDLAKAVDKLINLTHRDY